MIRIDKGQDLESGLEVGGIKAVTVDHGVPIGPRAITGYHAGPVQMPCVIDVVGPSRGRQEAAQQTDHNHRVTEESIEVGAGSWAVDGRIVLGHVRHLGAGGVSASCGATFPTS